MTLLGLENSSETPRCESQVLLSALEAGKRWQIHRRKAGNQGLQKRVKLGIRKASSFLGMTRIPIRSVRLPCSAYVKLHDSSGVKSLHTTRRQSIY